MLGTIIDVPSGHGFVDVQYDELNNPSRTDIAELTLEPEYAFYMEMEKL
jgi:hypothetical protein